MLGAPPRTSFQSFLTAHTGLLTHVVDRASLAEWHTHFAKAWRANTAALVEDANDTLDLSGDMAIQPDLGYLAVERAGPRNGRTWVLVSANPGWNEVTSSKERTRKGDVDPFDLSAYHDFRTACFPGWWDAAVDGLRPRGAGWWDRALAFVHEVGGYPRATSRRAVHPDLDLIGWELWPFHSRRDGLTGAMKRCPELRLFAQASVAAACRMPDARVIVASKAGYELLREAALPNVEHGAAYVADERADGTLSNLTVVRVLRAEGGRVLGIGRQLFSAWGNVSRPLRAQIVGIARGDQTLPSIAEAESARERVVPVQRSRRSKSVAAISPPVLTPAQTRQAELVLAPESPTGGLVMLLPVRDVNGLGDLNPNADDATVSERIGGYWRSSRSATGRLAKVQAALDARLQVWIIAYNDRRVLRAMRVEAGALDAMPAAFKYNDDERNGPFEHDRDASTADGAVFARVYKGARTDKNGSRWTEYRVRYRVVFVADDDLRGRLLSADEPINWQAPLLYRLPVASAPAATTPSLLKA